MTFTARGRVAFDGFTGLGVIRSPPAGFPTTLWYISPHVRVGLHIFAEQRNQRLCEGVAEHQLRSDDQDLEGTVSELSSMDLSAVVLLG